MHRRIFLLQFTITALCGFEMKAAASNWPQFRGPQASGIAEQAPPTTWDMKSGENIRWQKEIGGLAHACPIVWEDRLYVTTAINPAGKPELKVGLYGEGKSYTELEKHQWRLLCFEKRSGKMLWDKLAFEGVPKVERHTKASHCNSTPATDGKRIVAIFGSEGLFAYDMDGKPLWHIDLGKMDAGPYNDPTLQWGFASSPILHENRVIVQCDVLSESYIAVFDARDGKQIWRTERAEKGGSWCTPNVAITAKGQQILANGWKEIGGYDWSTGRQLWQIKGGGDIPVPTPVVADNLVFLTSAHGNYRPLRAVRLDASGDVSPPSVATTNDAVIWCHPRQGSYMQTPIVLNSLLFSCDSVGVLTCCDAATGKINFSERLSTGTQAFTSSPVAAAGNLYFTSEEGQVFVVPAKPQLNILATNKLDDICLSTPAISDGMLFFRTREKLVAIGKRSD